MLLLYKNVSVYRTDEDLECVDRAYFGNFTQKNWINENCLPQCPLECYLDEYRATMSSFMLVSDLHAEFIRERANLMNDFQSTHESNFIREVKESIVSVNVFYSSLSFTRVTESPQIDFIGLLANVGGNLGLFLNMGFFSLAEFCGLIIEIVYMRFERNKQRVYLQ
jgi:hypothetical protein